MSIWRTSASQLEMALFCGHQWEQVYVHNRRAPPGIALHVGTSLHKVSEHNFAAKIQSGEDEALDVLLDVARDGYVHRLQEEGVYLAREDATRKDELLNDGLAQAVEMSRTLRTDFAPTVRPVAVEREVHLFDAELGIAWVGYVDLEDEGDGSYVARDIKSAKSAWSAAQADAAVQATLYPRLLEATVGRRPDRFAFNVFKKLKARSEHQEVVAVRDDSDWQALRRKAAQVKRMIEAGLLPPADQSSWRCSEAACGFWATCPYISERRRRLPNR